MTTAAAEDAPPVLVMDGAPASLETDTGTPTTPEAPKAEKAKGKRPSGAQQRKAAAERRAANGDKAPRTTTSSRKPSVEVRLTKGILSVAELLALVEPYDSAVLTHNAAKLAKALGHYPGLANQLVRLMEAGDEAGGVVILLGVALPILAHHGLLPGQLGALSTVAAQALGTTPPPELVAGLQANRAALIEALTRPGTTTEEPATDAPAA